MRVRRTSRKMAGAIAAFGLIVAACGESDGAGPSTADPAAESVELVNDAETAGATEDDGAAEPLTTDTTPAASEPDATATPEPVETAEPDTGSCSAPQEEGPTLEVGVLAEFETDAGQNADGLTIDSAGNVYVSFAPLGQVARLGADGSAGEIVGTIPGWDDPFPGIGGLAFDRHGHLYAAASGSDITGIWVFECGLGEPNRIAGTESMGFPNDLVFDEAGNLYVSDLHTALADDEALGAIWRITPAGDIELWAEDALLGGTNAIGIGYLGANGLALADDRMYIAVTEKARIVEIPIDDDGEAGPLTVFAENEQLTFVEDVAVASDGTVFAVEAFTNSLVAVNGDGSFTTLAAGPGGRIDQPANVMVAPGGNADELLYVTNNARFSQQVDGVGPSVVAVGIDPAR